MSALDTRFDHMRQHHHPECLVSNNVEPDLAPGPLQHRPQDLRRGAHHPPARGHRPRTTRRPGNLTARCGRTLFTDLVVRSLRGPVRDGIDTDLDLRQQAEVKRFLSGMEEFLRGG